MINDAVGIWDHINPNQVEKKFGGNVNDMVSDFWPPKCVNNFYDNKYW